jgi:1,4-dihydroxy-2-naphthoate octaprenyltransferase
LDKSDINQFPDLRADAAAGKRHWVVRLGVRRAVWVYGLIAGMAGLWLVGAVAAGELPVPALLACLSFIPSVGALRRLNRDCDRPRTLAPAIRLTIAAALIHGVLLAFGIGLGRAI